MTKRMRRAIKRVDASGRIAAVTGMEGAELKSGKNEKKWPKIGDYFRNNAFQKAMVTVTAVIIALFIIENGAAPKKYRLSVGEKSNYDITAPRDIENRLLMEKLAREAAEKVSPVMIRLDSIPIDVINATDEFFNEIKLARQRIDKNLQELGVTKKDTDYQSLLEHEQAKALDLLKEKLDEYDIPLSEEQIKYMLILVSDDDLLQFEKFTKSLIGSVMKEEINENNLADRIIYVQGIFQDSELAPEFKNIGSLMAKALLRPNSIVDEDLTNQKRTDAYNAAMENRQIIREGSRIISYGDIVTEDKLYVLEELNLLETGKPDYAFALGIMSITLLLTFLLVLYVHFFCRKIISGTKEVILLSIIILLTLFAARILNSVNTLLIPAFIAPMLISILLDLRLGIVVNVLLSMAISIMTKGDQGFFCTAVIGGTMAAYLVHNATQRSRISVSGLVLAVANSVIIVSMGLIAKNDVHTMLKNSAIVASNGMLSAIFTIGTLPIFESAFNIVTPLKLLELSNPNHPLMKRLLVEAPGTYHHSLMVGNLAEVAAEAVNGNALLARVGAYYHDVGKLKRPDYFKENQLSENPHDKMDPNLSALVIISHVSDGVEIADKYKLPQAIKNIISQHHGTTLVAYFYYKALKNNNNESVKQEDFRYRGMRPASKEAAVVMLADSVEAAVRSMSDKTESKIEGLIMKIIKDKLDDGQLDLCDLTLKDLDKIAKAFMRVFWGYFHKREAYPEVEIKKLTEEPETVGAEDITSEDAYSRHELRHSREMHGRSRDENEKLQV